MRFLSWALVPWIALLPACSCASSHLPAADAALADAAPSDAAVADAPEAETADADVDAAIVPGICGMPFVLIDDAHRGADGVYRADVDTDGRLDEVSCARDGAASERSGRVVHLVATEPGDWTLRVFGDGTTSQLRSRCADTSSELDCRGLTLSAPDVFPQVWHVAAAGESLDWLLRSRLEHASFTVEAWPPRHEGESCAVVAGDASMISVGCVLPLRCTNWAPMPICALNTAPTLQRVELYTDGSPSGGHLILWGTDTTPNLFSLRGTAPGSAGFDYFVTRPTFDGASFVVDFYEPIPAAAAFDVVIGDGVSTSNAVHAVVQPSGAGEPCALLGACPGGLTCADDGSGTRRCQP